jgi:hypothetical protein
MTNTSGRITPCESVADTKKNGGPGNPLPHLDSDEAADAFIASANLSDYDLSALVKTQVTISDEKAR